MLTHTQTLTQILLILTQILPIHITSHKFYKENYKHFKYAYIHTYAHTHTHSHTHIIHTYTYIHRNMYISIFSPIFKTVGPVHFPKALLRIVVHLVFDSLTVLNVPITAYLVTLAFTYVLQPTNHLEQLLSHLPPSNLSCIFCS